MLPDPPKQIDLLFSHLHLDHIVGLPFFKPVMYGRDVTVRTWCGNLDGESAQASLDRVFAPPLFPLKLDQFPGYFEHHGFRAGETLRFEDGLSVRTCPLNHPSGATGYRFDHAGRAICYVSDIEHDDSDWPPRNLLDFVAGADLVIYDGMFAENEYDRCRGWGHSTWEKGVELCNAGGAKAMALFHLHPLHDDARLRQTETELKAVLPGSFVARQGQNVRFEPLSATASPARHETLPA
jgi:phosphoribosyl 1,2-cyclic phosphodiesterase